MDDGVRKCRLCGAPAVREWDLDDFAIQRCTECDLRFPVVGSDVMVQCDYDGDALPGPSGAVLCRSDYFGAESGSRGPISGAMLSVCSQIVPGFSTLLDVGSGAGDLVALARGAGVEAVGVDISRRAVDLARIQHGPWYRHSNNLLDFAVTQSGSFDAVTMVDSIEHMDDPASVLRALCGALSAEGRLIALFPNAGGWLSRSLGRDYRHYSADHPFLFSRKSFLECCRRADTHVYSLESFTSILGTLTEFPGLMHKYRFERDHLLAVLGR